MANGLFGGGTGVELDPYLIEDGYDIIAMFDTEALYFKQNNNIDLSEWANWTPAWLRSGTTFDGDNFEINNLTINATSGYDIGLFDSGYGIFKNIKMKNAIITTTTIYSTGVLIGSPGSNSFFDNIHIKNAIVNTQNGYCGGLGNGDNDMTVTNCTVSGVFSGQQRVGGLFGGTGSGTVIQNCFCDVSIIITSQYAGALIGVTGTSNIITKCHGTGSIEGFNTVGGLIGSLENYSTLENSFFSGEKVESSTSGMGGDCGGLVGRVNRGSVTKNCYAITTLLGYWQIGGLIGYVNTDSAANITVENCYSACVVPKNTEDPDYSGGLLGRVINSLYLDIRNSYYDIDIQSNSDTDKGEPKTTVEMQDILTYAIWDIAEQSVIVQSEQGWNTNYIWGIGALNNGYPYLLIESSFVRIRKQHYLTGGESTAMLGSETDGVFFSRPVENNIRFMTSDGTHLYFVTQGTFNPPYGLIKFNIATMTRVNRYDSLTQIQTIAVDSSYVYLMVGVPASFFRVIKLDSVTMQEIQSTENIPGYPIGSYVIDNTLYLVGQNFSDSSQLMTLNTNSLVPTGYKNFNVTSLNGITADSSNLYVSYNTLFKVDPTTLETLSSVAISTICNSLVISGTSLLASSDSSNIMRRIDIATMEVTHTQNLSPTSVRINAVGADINYFYVIFNSSPFTLWKLNTSNLSVYSTYTGNSFQTDSKCIVVTDTYVYFSAATWNTSRYSIYRLTKDPLTASGSTLLADSEGTMNPSTVHGNYMYMYTHNTNNSKIICVDIATMKRVEELAVPPGGTQLGTTLFVLGDILYFYNSGNRVMHEISVAPSMSIIGVHTLPAIPNAISLRMTTDGTYGYVSYIQSSAFRISKVDLTNYTYVAQSPVISESSGATVMHYEGRVYARYGGLTTGTVYVLNAFDLSIIHANLFSGISGMFVANGYLYETIPSNDTFSLINKYDINDYSLLGTLNIGSTGEVSLFYDSEDKVLLATGANNRFAVIDENSFSIIGFFTAGYNFSTIVYKSSGYYYGMEYFTTSGPFQRIKINTKVTLPHTQSPYALFSGDQVSYGSISDGEYGYIASAASPIRLRKINLSNGELVATNTLETGENSLSQQIIYGDYIYLCTHTSPARVVKYNKNTLTRVEALTLNTGENNALAICTDGAYVYVGVQTSPGVIVKIDMATMTRVASVILPIGENSVQALAHHDGILYACVSGFPEPSFVIKFDTANLNKLSSLSLGTGTGNDSEQAGRGIIIDNDMLYVTTSKHYTVEGVLRTNYHLSKISLLSFSRIAYMVLEKAPIKITKIKNKFYIGANNSTFYIVSPNNFILELEYVVPTTSVTSVIGILPQNDTVEYVWVTLGSLPVQYAKVYLPTAAKKLSRTERYLATNTEPNNTSPPLEGFIEIWTAEDLDNIRNNLSGKYVQMADIDLAAWGQWEPIAGQYSMPNYSKFEGEFDGNGFTISNISYAVSNTITRYYLGLFGYGVGAAFKNVIIDGVSISRTYGYEMGGLLGGGVSCTLLNCIVKNATVSSSFGYSLGGLVGRTNKCIIELCGVEGGTITGAREIGGLVGLMDVWPSDYTPGLSTASNCWSTANVRVTEERGGGFVGLHAIGEIKESYCTGNVTATSSSNRWAMGGFVGGAMTGHITDCYARGYVYSSASIEGAGGFIGTTGGNTVYGGTVDPWPVVSTLTRCYSTGAVYSTHADTGGFLGVDWELGWRPTGETIITYKPAVFVDNHYDGETSGLTDTKGATPRTTTQMKTILSFIGWDFKKIWTIGRY